MATISAVGDKLWYLHRNNACHSCGCHYMLTDEDVFVVHGNRAQGYYSVESACPQCGAGVFLNNPYWVLRQKPIDPGTSV